jgi:hypothetical protein
MPRTHAVQPGAAGVSQPWFRETRLQRQHRNCRAEATSRWSVHEHRCNRVTHTHGGLTPAALVPASRGRCTVRDFCATAFGSPYHGGLTPAALVNVRSFIAKIVIISADGRRSRNKSGGRKPPVVRETCLQVIWSTPCATLHRVHTHGGLTPAALDSAVVLHQTSVGAPCKRGPSPTTAG